jgi:hypothetical protein
VLYRQPESTLMRCRMSGMVEAVLSGKHNHNASVLRLKPAENRSASLSRAASALLMNGSPADSDHPKRNL